jgi:SNF2 family DNA or RNA helicase
MIQKYQRQLAQANLWPLPAWEEIAEHYSVEQVVHVKGTIRLSADKEFLIYQGPYDPQVLIKAKSIKPCNFDFQSKSWLWPFNCAEEVGSKFPQNEFDWTDEAIEAIYEAIRVREEAELSRKKEIENKALKLNLLIEQAELSKPLPNGWTLREYQIKAVEWLLFHSKPFGLGGAILADHMGLGKSLTTIVAAKLLRDYLGDETSIIVVCPASLKEMWVRTAEMVQTSVEVFSNHFKSIPLPLDRPYILITDEAHCFQDPKSKRTQSLLNLAHNENCKAAWLLTGTPLKNGRPINLLPLLMAIKHKLAEDINHYQRYFCNATTRSIGRGKSIWDVSGAAHLDELAKKTQDCILRRTKSEVLKELPEKERTMLPVMLDNEREYKSTINTKVAEYRQRVQLGEVSADAEALVTLNFLRNVGSRYKVDATCELAEQILGEGRQVVIFTEFVDSARLIAENLKNYGVELLTGETKIEERQNMVDRFQSGQSKVFVGTIRAGGVGLTLTVASDVILTDRAWTPGDCEQVEDRCHRLGQKNSVMAYWLQLGMIDEYMNKFLTQKQERIELVLKGKRKTLRGIGSPAELAKELLEIL